MPDTIVPAVDTPVVATPVVEPVIESKPNVTTISDATETWLKGQREARKVARETPVKPVEAPEAVKAPEGEVKVDKSVEGQPEAPVTPSERFRKPDGTFAKAVKAKFGDTEFEIPEGLLVPLKRGDVVEYKPLEQVQKEGMLYNDYNKSKQELKAPLNEARAEAVKAKAIAETWQAIVKDVLENPEKALKYRDDPEVATLWADSAELRINAASTKAVNDFSAQEANASAEQDIRSWASDLSTEFQGVDAQYVLQQYGTYLMSEQAKRDPQSISATRLKEFFAKEHSRLDAIVGPERKRVQELEARVEALTKGAITNAQTEHALKRAATPPVSVAGGSGVTTANTGPIVGTNGQPLSLNDAHKAFLARHQK